MINIISIVLIVLGVFFFFATTIGILRFPDFYSRMHAAGKGDTLSSLLVLGGLALFNLHDFSVSSILVSLKIMFICVFIFMASPTATHHIIEAGFESGVKPWKKESKKSDDQDKSKMDKVT
jgi:multicomponent Na+:H+ antiporter subunit G